MSGGREERNAAARQRKVPPEVLEAAMALVNTLAANSAFREQIAEEEIARRIEDGDLIATEKLSIAPGLVLVPRGRIPELEAAARVVVKAWMEIPNEQGWTDEEVVLSRAVKGLAALFLDEFDSENGADNIDPDHTPVRRRVRSRRRRRRPDPGHDQTDSSSFSTSDEEPNQEPPAPNRDFVPSSEGRKPGIEQVSGTSTAEQEAAALDAAPSDVSGSSTLPEGAETGNAPPAGMPEKGDRGPCEECGAAIEEEDQARLSWILSRRKLCRSCHVGDTPPSDTPEHEEETDAAPGDA